MQPVNVTVLWSDKCIYVVNTSDLLEKLKTYFSCHEVFIDYKLHIVTLLLKNGEIRRFSFSDGKII